MAFKETSTCYKKQKYFMLPDHLLFLVCKKGQTEDKTEFLTKSVGTIVAIIFM